MTKKNRVLYRAHLDPQVKLLRGSNDLISSYTYIVGVVAVSVFAVFIL
jgi:hypothetical protein